MAYEDEDGSYDDGMAAVDMVTVMDGPPPVDAVPLVQDTDHDGWAIPAIPVIPVGGSIYSTGEDAIAAYTWWRDHQRQIKIGVAIVGGVLLGLVVWRIVFK